MIADLSWPDIRHGAIVGLIGALPLVLAAQIVSVLADVDLDREGEFTFALGVTIVLGLMSFVAMGAGGFVAARRQPEWPLSHGLLAALGAYAVIQAFGVIRLAVIGEDIAWARIVLNAVLAAGAGLAAALAADRRNRRDAAQRMRTVEERDYGRRLPDGDTES